MKIAFILLVCFLLPFLSGVLGGSIIAWRCYGKLIKIMNKFTKLLEEDIKND